MVPWMSEYSHSHAATLKAFRLLNTMLLRKRGVGTLPTQPTPAVADAVEVFCAMVVKVMVPTLPSWMRMPPTLLPVLPLSTMKLFWMANIVPEMARPPPWLRLKVERSMLIMQLVASRPRPAFMVTVVSMRRTTGVPLPLHEIPLGEPDPAASLTVTPSRVRLPLSPTTKTVALMTPGLTVAPLPTMTTVLFWIVTVPGSV